MHHIVIIVIIVIIAMLTFVLFHNITYYTNSLLSRIHANTTKLFDMTSILVATSVTLCTEFRVW